MAGPNSLGPPMNKEPKKGNPVTPEATVDDDLNLEQGGAGGSARATRGAVTPQDGRP